MTLDLHGLLKRRGTPMDEPKDVLIPMPPPSAAPSAPPPLQYLPPNARDQEDRDLMVRAAEAYDRSEKIIQDLKQKLADAIAAIKAKNTLIEQLELTLANERNFSSGYRNERDQAVQDRADLMGLFGNILAILERFQLPVAIPRIAKSHADATNGGTVKTPIEDEVPEDRPNQ